jgi:hypothetical protein
MATLSEEERRGVFDVRYRAFLRCASCDARGACSVRTTVIESQLFLAVQAVVMKVRAVIPVGEVPKRINTLVMR